MSSKWEQFRPSKTLWLWSCVGCVALTMIAGFSVGGWVTGGTAEQMAEDARDNARAQLAANICVAKFTQGSDFASALADLKAESSWSRDDFVTEGGWLTLTGLEEPVDGAADLCAEQLAVMDAPEPAPTTLGSNQPVKG